MSLKKISKSQPETFILSKENLLAANKEMKKYPKNKASSSVLALLFIVCVSYLLYSNLAFID